MTNDIPGIPSKLGDSAVTTAKICDYAVIKQKGTYTDEDRRCQKEYERRAKENQATKITAEENIQMDQADTSLVGKVEERNADSE